MVEMALTFSAVLPDYPFEPDIVAATLKEILRPLHPLRMTLSGRLNRFDGERDARAKDTLQY